MSTQLVLSVLSVFVGQSAPNNRKPPVGFQ